MSMRFNKLINILVLAVAATSLLASSSSAQQAPYIVRPTNIGVQDPSSYEPIGLETLPDVFERAFFNDSGDYFLNRTVKRQFEYIFGPGQFKHSAFPEREIDQDARVINTLYQNALDAQVSSDPVLRTPDLPNPYDTSLLRMPNPYGRRVRASEFVYEKVPLR